MEIQADEKSLSNYLFRVKGSATISTAQLDFLWCKDTPLVSLPDSTSVDDTHFIDHHCYLLWIFTG